MSTHRPTAASTTAVPVATGRIRVRKRAATHRYEVSLGGRPAGFAAYRDHDGRRIFFHTEISAAFGGQGLAGVLVAKALAATRAEGLRIVGVCPLVAAYVEKKSEYVEIADTATPELRDWLRAALTA